MKAGYVDKNYAKLGIVKIFSKVWPGIVFSRFSPFSLGEIEEPVIKFPSEVLVDNLLSGICGTDVSLLHARVDPRVAPTALSRYSRIFLGHENLSEITKIGSSVKGFDVGDRVTVTQGKSCQLMRLQNCSSCEKGLPYLCMNTSIPSKLHLDTGGGWAPKWKYDFQQLIKIPDDISNDLAVLTEPMGIAVHAVLRKLPGKEDNILVYGAGFIGQATILALKYFRPDANVYAICKYPFQKDLAQKNGAIPIDVNYEHIAEITGGHLNQGMLNNKMIMGGFDHVFDCVGNGSTIHHALRFTKARGTTVIVGVNLYLMKLDLSPVWYQEIDLLGSYGRGREHFNGQIYSTDDLTFEIFRSGIINPADLITHRFKLDEYKKAIHVLQNKKKYSAMKVVFEF